VLAIALVPSLVLLSAGVGLSTYLLVGALDQRDRAELLRQGYQMAAPFMPALSQERRASILVVADPSPQNRTALNEARHNMDGLLARFGAISSQVAGAMPAQAKTAVGIFVSKLPRIAELRRTIDTGQVSRLDVYRSYSEVAEAMVVAADAIGQDSTNRDVALQRTTAAGLMRVADWLDGGNALAAAALAGGGMTPDELHEYNRLTQGYRAELQALEPHLNDQLDELAALRASRPWRQLSAMESALVEQGFAATAGGAPNAGLPRFPVSPQEWQNAARDSATALSGMGLSGLGEQAATLEREEADTALLRSLIAAVAMLLVIGAVVIIALRMSNKLIRRLVRLRSETLKLADERLPRVVDRLRDGERIDIAAEVPELEHGKDELGQVAEAFNKAQRTAVAAAVQEAKIREGMNSVFLNIARRSQAIVHRQLQVLDTAERATDNPDQLELLFQLDHLTTRERRNAENLIILGGGQLGRQWRNSVSLVELVRSAVAEAEQYTRVTVAQVPEVLVDGRAVADLIHLLAELIDNATSFSPPGSRIEVRGNRVGKGVVIEVDDQGLGIEPDRRATLNAMFRNPPDFGLMTLSDDARIGFFVVAHLAHQHGIKVNLLESVYGGVRAGVLVLTELLTWPGPDGESSDPAGAKHRGIHQTSPSIPVVPAASASGVTAPAPAPAGPGSAGTERFVPQRGPGADDRPALPRRRRQANLAGQLRREPVNGAERQSTEPDFDQVAKHARDTLSAFQRGTQLGRSSED
jgi:signal transduction histidine kinase